MTTTLVPATLEVPFSALLALCQECWRLRRIAASTADQSLGLACNRSVREISTILAGQRIQIEDHCGRTYDPGMVPEVLDVIEDPLLAPGSARIERTVSPTVTWRGMVVVQGQIIVRQSPAGIAETAEERA